MGLGETFLALVPTALLLMFCLYGLLVSGLLWALHEDVIRPYWYLTALPMLGTWACLTLLRAFTLNRAPGRLTAQPFHKRRWISAGLGTGLLLSAGSLVFSIRANFAFDPYPAGLVLFTLLAPAVMAVRYLHLLHSSETSGELA